MKGDTQSDAYKNYENDFVTVPENSPSMIMPKATNTNTKEIVMKPRPRTALRIVAWTLLAVVLIIGSLGYVVYGKVHEQVSPANLPIVIDIPKGSSLQTATDILADNDLISSPLLFRMLMILGGAEHSVKTGEYTFNKPMTLSQTIDKVVNGKYEYVPVRLTIKEGENAAEIARSINLAFPKLAEADVYAAIKDKEGSLFPETYIFAPFVTIDEIVKTAQKEFENRMSVFRAEIASTTRSEREILTIASILEREVPHKADMKIVAGIIYNRLAQDMPLQMDSTLGFITGKASLELVTDDLKIESPYNTYINKGLPPTPIGNPGDVAIEAAINPDTNKYIFFLSDKDGVNHYAVTYAEHLKNRKTYLGK